MENPFSIEPGLWLIGLAVALPLAAFVALLFPTRIKKNRLAPLCTVATALAVFVAVVYDIVLATGGVDVSQGVQIGSFTISRVAGASVELSFGVDNFALLMVPVILVVSVCAQVFTRRHLKGERRIGWMLSLVALATAALCALVLARDLVSTLSCWIVLGTASLLMGAFWWENPRTVSQVSALAVSGAAADVLLIIAAVIGVNAMGTTSFADAPWALVPRPALAALLVCAMLAAIARSLQLPIHVGRLSVTTVPGEPASFINVFGVASTGPILLYRLHGALDLVPWMPVALLAVGIALAALSAVMACFSNDLRHILLCSTTSQVGVAITALGAGVPQLCAMHLVANAFFAPLLGLVFTVIARQTGTRDIRLISGLWPNMKLTAVLATFGALSLTGIAPLAGYFSRDGIVQALVDAGLWIPAALLAATTFATGFYLGRVLTRMFMGRERRPDAVDPGGAALGVLVALAVGTVAGGLFSGRILGFLGSTASQPRVYVTLVMSFVVVLAIWLSRRIYWYQRAHRTSDPVVVVAASDASDAGERIAVALRAVGRLFDKVDRNIAAATAIAVIVGVVVALVAVMSL